MEELQKGFERFTFFKNAKNYISDFETDSKWK